MNSMRTKYKKKNVVSALLAAGPEPMEAGSRMGTILLKRRCFLRKDFRR